MKKFQSVLCTLVLALSLSSPVLAGNIHGASAPSDGNIHGAPSDGNIHGANGILLSDFFMSSVITGAIASIFGNIHG